MFVTYKFNGLFPIFFFIIFFLLSLYPFTKYKIKFCEGFEGDGYFVSEQDGYGVRVAAEISGWIHR